MADGDGERVGCVSGLGGFGEIEVAGYLELDLLFGGEAVADDGALDGEGGVLGYWEVAVGGCEHGDSADLAEFEGALGVGGEEDFFDGDDFGLPEFEEGGQLGVDLEEAHGGPIFFVEADGSSAEGAKPGVATGVIDFDDAVAGELCSAVDTEDAHGVSLARGGLLKSGRLYVVTAVVGKSGFATGGRDRYNRRDATKVEAGHTD